MVVCFLQRNLVKSVFQNWLVDLSGFPNVGKSSVINSLKRNKSCSVGATPGVTK